MLLNQPDRRSYRRAKCPAVCRTGSLLPLLLIGMLLAACTDLAGEPRIIATVPPPFTPAPTAQLSRLPDATVGAATFAQQCISCHGTGGAANGELVLSGSVPQMVAFTEASLIRDRSPEGWFEVISRGRLEKLMPPWEGVLSVQERWNVVAHIFSLRYSSDEIRQGESLWTEHCASCQPPTLKTLLPLSDQALLDTISPWFEGKVEGDALWPVVAYLRTQSFTTPSEGILAAYGPIQIQVNNNTRPEMPLAGLPLTLFAVNERFEVQELQAVTDAAGSARFEAVPLDSNYTYLVGVVHQERLFFSDFARAENLDEPIPLTIYDLMDDPTQLTITEMVYQLTPVESGVEVVQSVTFRNDSDRAYSTSEAVAENVFTSARLPLPLGAVGLQPPGDSERYIFSEAPLMFVDTVPVLPGNTHTMQIAYLLPTSDSVMVDQPLEYALDAQVQAVIHPTTLQIESAQINPVDGEAGPSTRYSGQLRLPVGDRIQFEISPIPVEDNRWLFIALGIGVGIIALVSGIYLVNRVVGSPFAKPTTGSQST